MCTGRTAADCSSRYCSQAVAALGFVVGHPQYCHPKKDEALVALIRLMATVCCTSEVLLVAERMAPGCAVELARAGLRGVGEEHKRLLVGLSSRA